MKPFLTIVLLLFASACFALTTSHTLRLHFDSDKYELTEESKVKLQNFLSELELDGDYEIYIAGHTDSDATDDYNAVLAMNRAKSVREFCLQMVDERMIFVDAHGERSPLVSNSTSENKALNRRVDVIFRSYHFDSLEDFRKELGLFNKESVIVPAGETMNYITREGSIIHIDESAFVDADGNPIEGDVTLNITEAMDLMDFLAEDLYTLSDGQLLESGGMFNFSASTMDGEEVALNEEGLTVAIPRQVQDTSMQLFVSNNGGNWDPVGQYPLDVPQMEFPKFPEREHAEFKAPKFILDESNKPRNPAEPLEPREPKSPDPKKYEKEYKWNLFKSRKKRMERDQKNLSRAMSNYDRKLNKYDDKVQRFEEYRNTYPEKYTRYREEFAAWEEEQRLREEYHYLVVVPKAEKEYLRKNEELEKKYREKLTVYMEQCDSIREEHTQKLLDMGLADQENLNYYVFNVSDLGWINCDRFYDVPEEAKHDIIVDATNEADQSLCLIFEDIKSMSRFDPIGDGRFYAKNMPKDEDKILFAYKVEDGRVMVSYEKFTSKKNLSLDYRLSTLAEVKELMKGISS